MPRRLATAALSVLLLCAWGAPLASAQEEEGGRYDRIDPSQTTVAYFMHARPGVPTIEVSVWGTVPRPGIYAVGRDTELDRLITMAGGVLAQERTEDVERDITVRLFREGEGEREMIYEAPIEDLLRDTGAYPSLQGSDVLVVETQVDYVLNWRDILGVVGSIGSLALVVERLFFR